MPPLPHHALHGFRALLHGFSQIFLQAHAGCGLLIVLAILVGAPDLLGGALLGGLSSMLVAQRRGYTKADIDSGLYGYNGILLGLLISLHFSWSPLIPLLIIVSAGLSSLLLAPWMQRMRERHWLPAFTFPFVALSWLLLWLAPPLQLQPQPIAEAALPSIGWFSALLALARGLGQVIFLEAPLAGLCLLLGLCLANRRAALWALLGSAGGLSLALHQGWAQHSALAGLYGYNAALAAIALSQVHRQAWVALLGIVLALLLQPGFTAVGLPALSMPFILACWLIQASQRLLRRAAADCAPMR
ncbi:urea transporter [Pseudomonas sp. UBA2684]|uniref:urea transporter n=1 Tax=Pseudomonas sp. UBA2684 TaxID=1947311 RepID=UPI000E9A103A|nr:urea transporter [Pseudomonas sp. UBA2684]HBX57251.1 urea transporter [Pseudomonas sp.]|tara:strand:+ start:2979 stop:3884 length:906 start_codon:yes stop_codon:yes gene_type:complete